MKLLKAVIPAAGKSTRTFPITLTRPKTLIPIANKSIIERNLESLKGFVDEVIIIVGFMKEMIQDKLGDNFHGIKITYVEQKDQLGTGHAISCAKDFIDGRFISLNGDDLYSRKDIENCLKHDFSVLVKEVDDPEKWGICTVDNDNKLTGIVEKPKDAPSNLGNTCLYVLDSSIFDVEIKKSSRGEFEFTDMVSEFSKTHDVFVEKVQDYWIPVGYPWHIIEANEFFVNKIKGQNIKGIIEDNVIIKGEVVIGEGSVLKSGTYIEGPVIIGDNCEIGPNCYLRKGVILGNNCKIGQACEVKNTIVFNNSKIPHLSYIGDSVIGEHVNLGAGTITANLRHDNANVKSEVKDNILDSGRRKFGTVIGDNVHTGINTMIYPGRKIWPNCSTVPGEIVKKDIKE